MKHGYTQTMFTGLSKQTYDQMIDYKMADITAFYLGYRNSLLSQVLILRQPLRFNSLTLSSINC